MSFLVAPPGHHNGTPSDGDGVDHLLRAFYKAEMPDPWPSFEAPAEAPSVLPFPMSTPAPAAGRLVLTRSRLALAASVALLVGGLAFLSGKFTDAPAQDPGYRRISDTAIHEKAGEKFKTYIDGEEVKVIIGETPPGMMP